jgi:putative colanic acid biosynthesis acetyltransferase WcaF
MTIEQHDIPANMRSCAAAYSTRDRVRRVLWGLTKPLFHGSPRHLYAWRNFLLRVFGANIGRAVRIYPSVRIFAPWHLSVGDEASVGWNANIYNLEPVAIGARAIVSQHAHLCSGNHDHRQAHMPFANKPITLEADCWICTDAFVGPGVVVGRLAVVGARAVVMRNVAPRAIVVGNPAREVGTR